MVLVVFWFLLISNIDWDVIFFLDGIVWVYEYVCKIYWFYDEVDKLVF